MVEDFDFKTFVDVHHGVFDEYISSVIAKKHKSDPKHRAIADKIDGLYEQYPKVLAVIDVEEASELTEQECKALIEVLILKNESVNLEMESVYFKGCVDCVGYLKKAGAL